MLVKAITLCLIVVGLINFVPVFAGLSAHKIESAYSITLANPDMAILMRHRALLFGILGGFILYAAFVPQFQVAAMLMAGVSMLGYAYLTFTTDVYNEALGKVLMFDLIGVFFLAVAVVLKVLSTKIH